MQFLIIILINIILWALFYVIITLKLEKSASEFREKKLRKEMDDIIREFNSAAERNISLLENRIKTLKRLLERSGDIKSVDFILDENGFTEHNVCDDNSITNNNSGGDQNTIAERIDKNKRVPFYVLVFEGIKKGLIFIEERISDFSFTLKSGNFSGKKNRLDETEKQISDGIKFQKPVEDSFPIVKDMGFINCRELPDADVVLPKKELIEQDFDEEVLEKLFQTTNDRYSLVAELYKKGYPLESLSRYSGIPAGEIRLVLNLEGSI